MTGELVPLSADLARRQEDRTLTVDEMRQYLLDYLTTHPEIKQGLALELWWDGRMAGRVGGPMTMPGNVTTIEHPDPDALKRMMGRPLGDFNPNRRNLS